MNQEQVNRILDAITPIGREQLEAFISRATLYGRERVALPDFVMNIAPRAVLFHCDVCRAERPFRAPEGDKWYQPIVRRHVARSGPAAVGLAAKESGIYEFYFTCSGCDQKVLVVWLEFDFENSTIRKVGQSLPWRINIDKELEKDLGEDADLYKKALVLLSQSYGIGACAYLRRIIENQINPLLEILYEIRQQEGAETPELNSIKEAMSRKDFTTKAEIAANILPDSIKIEGENPLKVIHDTLSANLHSLPEDEVISIALGLQIAFEYVVVELNRRRRSRQKYLEAFKTLRQKN